MLISFSSLAFLCSSVFMANLSHLQLVAASFSSLALLSSSVSTARFYPLRVARHCFSWFSVFLFSRLILSHSFLCSSVSENLFALSFNLPKPTLSMRMFWPHNSAYAFWPMYRQYKYSTLPHGISVYIAPFTRVRVEYLVYYIGYYP